MVKIILTLLATCAISSSALAAPVKVTLSNYAFDFTSVGYEISVIGTSYYISDPLDSDDYFSLKDGGYTMETVIGGLSRTNKKSFINYYNENCKYSVGGRHACHLMVTGEVALNDVMKMILTADEIKVCNKDCTEVLAVFD